jgi:hypothetical protein
MKKFITTTIEVTVIIVVAIAFFLAFLFYTPSTYAQSIQRTGNVFVTTNSSSKGNVEKTKYQWQDSTGKKYDIYISKKSGACFVIRTSKKSGKEYKYYLSDEITSQICKEMGVKRVKRARKK